MPSGSVMTGAGPRRPSGSMRLGYVGRPGCPACGQPSLPARDLNRADQALRARERRRSGRRWLPADSAPASSTSGSPWATRTHPPAPATWQWQSPGRVSAPEGEGVHCAWPPPWRAAAEEEIALLRAEDAQTELAPAAYRDARRMDSPGVAKPVADAAPEGASTGARAVAGGGEASSRLSRHPGAPGRQCARARSQDRSAAAPSPSACALIRSRRQMITRKSLRKDQAITCGDGGPGVP